MTRATALPEDPLFLRVRRGLLWLAALTSAGIAVELAVERHWTQPGQLIAWGALAALLVAIALVARRPSARRVRIVRVLAGLVMITSVVGVWQHVAANYDAGPLDFRYTSVWDSLPELWRWWLAVSKTVGAAPPLAPGALAQAALAVLLATVNKHRLAASAGLPPALAGGGFAPSVASSPAGEFGTVSSVRSRRVCREL